MRIDPSDAVKHTADGLAVTAMLGTLINFLPAIAALLTVIWTGIRIYETRTVQALFGRSKAEETNDD